MASKITSYKELLDQKQYLKLILANVVSRFGDSLDMIAFSWIMYQVTKSASMIALIAALNFIPNIIIQPFAGVLVDRFSKKRMMLLCDLGRSAMICLTVISYLFGWLNAPALVGITVVNSTLESFRMPAGNALVPKILAQEKYTLATSLNQTLSRIMELIGTACAGGIIALWGSPAALLIDGATFLFSAVVIAFIRYKDTLDETAFGIRSYSDKLKEGFGYLKANHLLFCIMILGALMNFSATPINSFMTPYIAENLSMGAEMLSAVGVAITAGMAVGSFFVPKLEKKLRTKTVFFLSGMLMSLFYLALWFLPALKAGLVAITSLLLTFFLMGFSSGIQNVIFSAAFMSNVEADLMGRISAILNAFLVCIMPIGSLLCSLLAKFISVPWIFLGAFVLCLLIYGTIATRKVYDGL